MRVVLDANVLVAAFGFGGVCRAIVEVCLVTGDKDLLTLGQIGGRPILSPGQFWQRLK